MELDEEKLNRMIEIAHRQIRQSEVISQTMLQLIIIMKEREQDIGELQAKLTQAEYEIINCTEAIRADKYQIMKLKRETQELAERCFDLDTMNEELNVKVMNLKKIAMPKKVANSCVQTKPVVHTKGAQTDPMNCTKVKIKQTQTDRPYNSNQKYIATAAVGTQTCQEI